MMIIEVRVYAHLLVCYLACLIQLKQNREREEKKYYLTPSAPFPFRRKTLATVHHVFPQMAYHRRPTGITSRQNKIKLKLNSIPTFFLLDDTPKRDISLPMATLVVDIAPAPAPVVLRGHSHRAWW